MTSRVKSRGIVKYSQDSLLHPACFCRADVAIYDFFMQAFSVYTGITSHVSFPPSPFIHEKRKLQEGNIVVSLCIRKIASAILKTKQGRRLPRIWHMHGYADERFQEQKIPFQHFLWLTLAFYTFHFITNIESYEWKMCNLAPVLERH